MFARGGGRGPRNGPERGADLRYDVEITLEQAFRGMEREIVVPRAQACEPCGGSGSEGNAPLETCATCQGAGQVRASQGMFRIVRTCPACHGRGQSIKNAVPLLRRTRAHSAERAHALGENPRRALKTAPASACPAKAIWAAATARRAISISSSR